MIDLNVTLLIQLINFVVTLVVINILLIRPVRDVMRRRKAARDDLNAGIQGLVAQVAQELGTYEDVLRKARKQAAEMVFVAREAGQEGQVELITKASAEAGDEVRGARERSQGAAAQALRDLEQEIPRLADDVVNRLLA